MNSKVTCRECGHIGNVQRDCKMFACAVCGLMQYASQSTVDRMPNELSGVEILNAAILHNWDSAKGNLDVAYLSAHILMGQLAIDIRNEA